MKYTNLNDYDDALVRIVKNDPYTKGKSDFSATGLQVPPRAFALIEKFGAQIEVDVDSRIDAIMGQGIHKVVERAERPGIDIVERRYFGDFTVDGKIYIVSAQIDLYESDTKTLSDWKSSKAYAFHQKAGYGNKPEWVGQLNVGAELMRRSGFEVEHLKIHGFLKDFDRMKTLTEFGYPKTRFKTVPIELWPSQRTVRYIEGRIRALVAARTSLPLCTAKETWGGNRCQQWCDAKSVCDQYKDLKKTGILKTGETNAV